MSIVIVGVQLSYVYMESENGSHRFILDGETGSVNLDILNEKAITKFNSAKTKLAPLYRSKDLEIMRECMEKLLPIFMKQYLSKN